MISLLLDHLFKPDTLGFFCLGIWYVFMCVCPLPMQAIKNHSCEARIFNQTSPIVIQFLYVHVTLAINITGGHGLSNEARH